MLRPLYQLVITHKKQLGDLVTEHHLEWVDKGLEALLSTAFFVVGEKHFKVKN